MKKLSLKLLAMLLIAAMLCSMLPAVATAADVEAAPQEISKKAEAIIEADIWSVIDQFEDDNIIATRDDPVSEEDYAELSDEIEALVKQSDTFVEDSIVRNGDFFTWETSEGIVCGYSPALRFKTRNNSATGNDSIEVKSYATKAAPSSKDVYLIAPYYGYDSSFTNQYKNEASSIASATGGEYTLYQGTNATITNIATAMQNGGVVIFDSHGITDYSNGEDYVSRANSSYLCLKTSTGITSTDMKAVSGTYSTYYHAFNGGSGTYCVDGTAISNHMTKAAPGTILWMAICLGMATNGLCIPMRNAGVEVVYGYSQSVSFTGDYKYETYFWNKMKAGSDVKTAVSYMKSASGSNWDPAYASYSLSQAKSNYVAFPIVVSDQDTYPGQGKVDAVQTVYSTYKLIDGSSSGGSTTPTETTAPDDGGTVETYTYNLVTSASNLTAGEYIIITVGSDGNYYALTTTKDGSYAVMQSNQVGLSSVASAITCDTSYAPSLAFNLSGNANGFTLSNSNGSLYAYSGDDGVGLYYGTASTWTGSYNSSSKGFTLKSGSLYLALRDDASVTGENGTPIFAVSSSTSTGTTLMHMYKRENSSTCAHTSTSTTTTPATCTTPGSTVVTCNACSAVVSTTEIPATGHNITYTSNNDGTHDLYCSNCGGTGTADCTYTNNVCKYCGYTNTSGSTDTTQETYTLVQSAADLTSGEYLILATGSGDYAQYSHYIMLPQADDNYAAIQSGGLNFDSLPGGLLLDAASKSGYVWTISGNANGFTIKSPAGTYLTSTSGATNLSLSSTSSTWKGTYSSSNYGFTVSSNSRYLALRDDIDTVGSNSEALFTTVSSSGVYVHLYKKGTEFTECAHSNTSTSTTPATCTQAGETVVTCNDCGETVSTTAIPATGHTSATTTTAATCTAAGKTVEYCKTCNVTLNTTTIPALGHDYKYTSNNDGTHKIGCSRCSYSSSANCTLVNDTCSYCGYTVEAELPEDPDVPEVPAVELAEGQYVIAANVDGVYYAMSNTFASKITGTEIAVTNGKVAAADAEGYVIELAEAEGGWTISDGAGNYLKYNSSTNLAKTTTAYAWTISEGTNGSWRVAAQTSGRGLVFRAKAYNQFGGYATSNCTAGNAEYFDIELLLIDGEIDAPEIPCAHEGTSTSTIPATCTAAGKITVICDDCGETISTETIPALGHDYKYTSNNDGTHKITCSRCSYSSSADCTLVNNTCSDCGYTAEAELPEEPDVPEIPAGELAEGKYVIAANVDGVYYAMSNTFASKIAGTEIAVTNGKVAAADAEGYVIELAEAEGGWTISDGAGNYLKYNSSTNLAKTTTAYAWTISEGTNGSWRVAAQTSGRGLVFRAKAYNQFGGYATSNCTAGSAEYFDIELLPVDGNVSGGTETEAFNVKIGHSLNLASDISINFAVTTAALSGYSNYYLECKVPTYSGNTKTGTETVTIQPVLNGNYYYFTMDGITAIQMNDVIDSVLYATKDGKQYASQVDSYSIATYAYNQLNKTEGVAAELQTLCAELLRYGAKAQILKAYRTDALADASMTAAHKALLTDLDSVVFGNNNKTLTDVTNPTVTWAGKSLILDSKVTLRMVANLSNYSGNVSDVSVRVTYTNLEGETVTETITEATPYGAGENYYAFDFSGLRAAEIRTVVSAAVYAGGKQVSPTLQYSMDTYGNNRTGDLLILCQALVSYSDSALEFFKK